MCGIVGYIGKRNVISILVDGLKRLEYRGYDSAGVAFRDKEGIRVFKIAGKVAELERMLIGLGSNSNIGIAHTRWATHGIPNEVNAHPHVDCTGNIAVVHNGIVENYQSLKKKLEKEGHIFKSQTDTEVIAHLIEEFYKIYGDIEIAVRNLFFEVKGTFGLAIMTSYDPDKIIVARRGSPIAIGIGNGENITASDPTAIIGITRDVIFLDDDEYAIITRDNVSVKRVDQNSVSELDKEIFKIEFELEQIEKGGFPHFMLKEIFEQPESIMNSMRGRVLIEDGDAKLGGLSDVMDKILNAKRFIIAACGTSWHAGLVGKYMIEQFARVPVVVEYASEFRYRDPVIYPDDVAWFISQSGETADTLAALRLVKSKGATALGIVNVVGSTIARESDAGVYIHAGPEIGVASTKAFTSQLVVLALITLLIGRRNGNISLEQGREIAQELVKLPEKVREILKLNDFIEEIAERLKEHRNFLYLGRGYNYPVALEGALKLKEISYIHAEGYPAAEMKHGPIALIDENMPVVFIAPKDSIYEKVLSNIEEVKARRGKVISIITERDDKILRVSDFVIQIPQTIEMLMPILTVIPLQLLAYHIAVKRGCDVDQPRNLAKSVTVE
ncbi:glutamine--fructose-6-phosphate transaminase [Candidatus Kryptonium thompsonii]|uniref:Glutamine--fructose-6-phosphate aminotransferase [isomerizing] n=3 Tax=Candidatus Kryptonium thompsonii TaxID=1633631 RepID=A0A0P1M1M6_9BACT|nr:glutamine--fructose-6-phosphate transaminase (isomerizing) [Candidatus Kryptonium thompsoni]CUS79108.1 glutamine--fructose-6-phosphate transaminase [Candidatus Kryptonium thompsoni]CUS85183.1 glutamine--fructose-6-phosphate transaminase [Candidatus Kryptonium thompsoni]CUS85799.1 glutamine--fructose-6-phosphate transaminase [Candidatus Kryptonium thompsoni]CUS87488.1 glutamine--fructose-6-phosphate transaminase [Candidatus Kryptonium thompsoni]CUS91550.1 glutamine--fructose-6-phosphate tran